MTGEAPSVETLDARIDTIQEQVHDLDGKFTSGFNDLHKRIDANANAAAASEQRILNALEAKFVRAEEVADRNRPTITNMLIVASGVAGVLVAILGGYGKLALDPISEHLRADQAAIQHITETTEKRDELQARFDIGSLRSTINATAIDYLRDHKVDKDVLHESQRRYDELISNLSDRIDGLEGKAATKTDVDRVMESLTKRQDLISNRVQDVSHESGQQIQGLQDKLLNPVTPPAAAGR